MGHDKLRKFAENETFSCLLQPSAADVLARGYAQLQDHPVKGHWNERMFGGAPGSRRDLVLELGCGKGEYTLDLARRNPDRTYVGVDIKGARLWRGAKTATQEALGNVAFLRTRIEFITAYFAPGEVSEIWLTFSDPQMKRENNRLSSPLFLERYRKIMRPGGVVHLKTDSRFLHEYTKAVVAANGLQLLCCTDDLYGGDSPASSVPQPSLTSAAVPGAGPKSVSAASLVAPIPPASFVASIPPASLVAPIPPAVREVQTFYERMFLDMGLPITYLSFVIDKEGPYVYPEFDAAFWRAAEGPRRSFSHQPTKR